MRRTTTASTVRREGGEEEEKEEEKEEGGEGRGRGGKDTVIRRPPSTVNQRLQERYAAIEREKFRRRALILGIATIALLACFAVGTIYRMRTRENEELQWQQTRAAAIKHQEEKRRRAEEARQLDDDNVDDDPWYLDDEGDRIAKVRHPGVASSQSERSTPSLLHHEKLTERETLRLNQRLATGKGLEEVSTFAHSPHLRKVLGDVETSLLISENPQRLSAHLHTLMSELTHDSWRFNPDNRLKAATSAVILRLLLNEQNKLLVRAANTTGVEKKQLIWQERELYLRLCICLDHLTHYLPDIADRKAIFDMNFKLYHRVDPDHPIDSPHSLRSFLTAWVAKMTQLEDDFSFPTLLDAWYPEYVEQRTGKKFEFR